MTRLVRVASARRRTMAAGCVANAVDPFARWS